MLTHPMRQRLFFGAVLWFAIAVGSHASAAAQVIVWDGPGGDRFPGPDSAAARFISRPISRWIWMPPTRSP